MKKMYLALLVALALVLVSCSGETQKQENVDVENTPEVEETVENNEEEKKEPVATLITLYFPDEQALYLHPEQRVIGISEDMQVERIILDQLFKGPTKEGLSPSLEGENLINSISVNEHGYCVVDFKSDFLLLNTGGTARESFVIGSIVNSLCELEHINMVKINIDGDEAAEFGHSTLDSVFMPQKDLIAK